jgi:hypothetical protein
MVGEPAHDPAVLAPRALLRNADAELTVDHLVHEAAVAFVRDEDGQPVLVAEAST